MNLEGILPFARTLLNTAASEGSAVIDATCGNGNDTLFLSRLVGVSGRVFGFDIQELAIQNTTRRLLEEHAFDNVTLFQAGHHTMKSAIPVHYHGTVAAAIFNLGYLPGGNKEIVTQSDSTIEALEQLFDLLATGGIAVLVIYHGHEQGKKERDAVLEYTRQLDQQKAHVLQYGFINQKNNPPFIVAIEKR
ncbi:tRNA (mnm(5)s(2)U34)-methyltransferase [Fictibacillus fluitans]|uniref:Class I SAM-dependent methyltransferase n=1 Tax=Fictibacillus fluitans TaxID=3058422 RepID=A0ABT8I0J2_9BACL|nr:class I SAM-dependent methyltransferase [Fictibacillus sp. NE201]MDN4526543.1 class I SAM-dependent methyltransferase [Fictibacillus sp. NE201]